MPESKSKFQKIKENAREYYKSIQNVYCPYLKREVSFPLNALHHIAYKKGRRKREVKDQINRYTALRIAPEILFNSGTVQEYELRRNKKVHKFWGFIAILNKKKIKVIVRQVGDGKPHFYSIFPRWITRMIVEG